MTTATVDGPSLAPPRDERGAATLAMVSFLVCSILGQVLVLWWARRHDAVFVRRYAWASLALEGVVAITMIPLAVLFFTAPSLGYSMLFLTASLLQAVLVVVAIVLAVRGWQGRDVAGSPLPQWLTERLP